MYFFAWMVLITPHVKNPMATKQKKSEKRKKPPTFEESLGDFFNQFWKLMILVPVSIFAVGGGGLYLSHLAKCNAIPTDATTMPFGTAHAIFKGSSHKSVHTSDNICSSKYNVDSKAGARAVTITQGVLTQFYNSFNDSPMRSLFEAADTAKHSPNILGYMYAVIARVMAANGTILTTTLKLLPGEKHGVWGELFSMVLLGLTWYLLFPMFYLVNIVLCIVYSITGLFDDSTQTKHGDIFSDGIGFAALARTGLRFVGLGITWFILCMGSGFVGLLTALYGIIMPLYIQYVAGVEDKKGVQMGGLGTFMTYLMQAKKNYFMWMTLGVLLWIISDVWGGTGAAALVISAIIMVVAGVLLHKDATSVAPNPVSMPMPKEQLLYSGDTFGGGRRCRAHK